MKILAAGGAGYIGTVLVPHLIEHGHDVEVRDLLWFGNHLPPSAQVEAGDLFDCTVAGLEGYDQVIFLAGLSNDPMAEFDPAMNFVHNAALPSYLAYAAQRAGARRFVYASSCSVYGHARDRLYDEDSPAASTYPYGISKLQGERGVLQLCDGGFSSISLRFGTVCGYSPRTRFDLIVNTMFKSACLEGKIRVNNPATWRPLVDVRDAALAFRRAVEAESGTSGVFNVAYDNFTVGQVAEQVGAEIEALTGERIEIETHHQPEMRDYRVSCARARSVLGFEARYGVAEMVRSLHRHRAEFGDFSSPGYYNIEVFKALKRPT